MKFQRINRSDPEKVFVVCKNARSTTMTAGQAVIWAYNGTDDGLAVTIPATATRSLLAGVVSGSIAGGGYGEVQCFGHNADALVAGGTDVAVGSKLVAKNASFNLAVTATESIGDGGLIIGGQTFTTSTAAAKKVFIRCM